MVTGLRLRHLRRYGELGRLLVKYGRSDLAKQVQFDGLEPVDVDGAPPPEADELAADLEALGPTFIKLGQLLSTRTDVLPSAYTKALSRLQDDVAPLPLSEVDEVFVDDLDMARKDAYDWFDDDPLASASLGQVHRARLHNGHEVVVKVQRPGTREKIAEDMEALGELAALLDQHTDIGRRTGFTELLDQFSRTLTDELDYRREAANLRRLAEIVEPYDRLVVPQPVAELTTRRVLTMDYVPGRKVTDLTPVGRTDVDGAALADQLFRAYLDQILVEGFFHADPHPGNVLLTDDGRLVLLDLGMVARVPPRFADALVRLLVAVSGGQGDDAARVAIELGHPLDDFDERAFVRGASTLVDRSHGVGMGELDAGTLVMELNRLALETGLRLPPELAMLGKALLNLDQIARILDPAFDPAECVREHAEVVLRDRMRPTRERLINVALDAREFVEELPGRVNRVMDAVSSGELTVPVPPVPPVADRPPRPPRERSKLTALTLSAAVLAAGVMATVEAADIAEVDVAAGLAVCLLVVGAGLLAGSVYGRAPGLIAVGAVLTVATAVATVADVPFRGGAGERDWRPVSIETLEDEYHLGAGEAFLDLSDLDLDGRDRTVEVTLGMGELRVLLPPGGVEVDLDGHVGFGQLTVLGERDEGVNLDQRRTEGSGRDGRLELDLKVGMGELEVSR